MGVPTVRVDDPEGREITQEILGAVGFRARIFYVPFSFDSRLAARFMRQEVIDATQGSGNPNLFTDFGKGVPLLESNT